MAKKAGYQNVTAVPCDLDPEACRSWLITGKCIEECERKHLAAKDVPEPTMKAFLDKLRPGMKALIAARK